MRDAPRPGRPGGGRPMGHETRARLGGLGVVAKRGPGHMAAVGRRGRDGLDRYIAAQAGIPDDLPPEDYQARLDAARRAHFVRLAEARWGREG
jgi:hypothetical protein